MTDDDKLKINVLLAEYNTLRAEAVARSSHLFQLVAAAGASFAFVIGSFISWMTNWKVMPNTIFWVSLVLIIIAFIAVLAAVCVLSVMMRRDLEKAVRRVAEIELDVNERIGEDLLIWENLCGGRVTSYWDREAPCHPRSKLKELTRPQRSKNGDLLVQSEMPQ